MQLLLTAPPALATFSNSSSPAAKAFRQELENQIPLPFSLSADPKNQRLGSGGGTVFALHQAHRDSNSPLPALQWLGQTQHMLIHAGGESRRLPAYASLGKAFIPLPKSASLSPARLHPRLIEAQLPPLRRTLEEAGPQVACLVASGDVWLDFDGLQVPCVERDITGIGMQVPAETAQHFGVFFTPKEASERGGVQPVSRFLQKPSPEVIVRNEQSLSPWVDTGIWLLSAKALAVLFRRCGWDEKRKRFNTENGLPLPLDLYTEVGNALGEAGDVTPRLRESGFESLSQGVVPIRDARFLHLGSNRQLLDSCAERAAAAGENTRVFVSNASLAKAPRLHDGRAWIEGSALQHPLALGGENLVTGVPAQANVTRLQRYWCVDAIPTGKSGWILRPYHLDDACRGPASSEALVCGRPARGWLQARGLTVPDTDLYHLPLYPLGGYEILSQQWIDWFFAEEPDPTLSDTYRTLPRLSAAEISEKLDLSRYLESRRAHQKDEGRSILSSILAGSGAAHLGQDASRLAALVRDHPAPNIRRGDTTKLPAHKLARLQMLQAELTAASKRTEAQADAFRTLAHALTQSRSIRPSRPRLALKEDQIVWARSPVRLDLSGGWTDTPPHCLEFGGSVINVAILLNGQPPIQVFIRPRPEPLIELRSIDLGVSERITSYRSLGDFKNPRGNFSLAKAALALAGFHPDFQGESTGRTLPAALKQFGGGLEISMLSAIPKGSGLGSSSILAATLLTALSRACKLKWSPLDVYHRVSAVEQLLTTGGGWQDQAGALFPGAKHIQTKPGVRQDPEVVELPSHLLDRGAAEGRLLLYYTGITRMAKGILQEIVTSMFLGRVSTLETLLAMKSNTQQLAEAMTTSSREAFDRCIARSWRLNKELDSGTNPAAVQKILDFCGPDLVAAKLLGAGGGGYLFMCAKDADAGQRIRKRLEKRPPNARARFIDFAVSTHGIDVTVS